MTWHVLKRELCEIIIYRNCQVLSVFSLEPSIGSHRYHAETWKLWGACDVCECDRRINAFVVQTIRHYFRAYSYSLCQVQRLNSENGDLSTRRGNQMLRLRARRGQMCQLLSNFLKSILKRLPFNRIRRIKYPKTSQKFFLLSLDFLSLMVYCRTVKNLRYGTKR